MENDRGILATVSADQQEVERTPYVYLAETQNRLSYVSIFIWCNAAQVEEVQLMTYDIHDCITHSVLILHPQHHLHKRRFTCKLPCLVQQTARRSGSLAKQGDFWQLRIPMRPPSPSNGPRVTALDAPLTAAQLTELGPATWHCRYCSTVVADTQAANKFVSLPSQHWEELVDAWMCHTDQELNQNLVQAQKDLEHHTGLDRGQVHVSDRYIVISDAMLVGQGTFRDGVSVRS